jgi:hypothetical protein
MLFYLESLPYGSIVLNLLIPIIPFRYFLKIPPVKLPTKSPQSTLIQNYSAKIIYPFVLNYYTTFPIFLVSKYCLISSKIKGSSIVEGMVNFSPSVNCLITFLRIFPERVLGKRFTKIVFR